MDMKMNSGVRAQVAPQPQAGEPVEKPYAYEFGRSNGDDTFSVFIERSLPAKPHPDWPVKPLYASPQAANLVRVTDEMVEIAVSVYNTTAPDSLASREQMRAAIAAIGVGGQAVAWPEERANIPDPHNPGARIVGFRIREGDEAWGESGLSEPLFWLEKKCRATLSQPHPADERMVEALDEELLGRLEFGATNIGANLEAGECLVILAALSSKEGL